MTCAPVRESNLESVRKKYKELNDREAIFELSKNEDFNHYAELLQLYSEPKSIPELEPMYNVPIDTITDFQETGKNGNCKKKCFCNHFIFQQVTLFSCLFLSCFSGHFWSAFLERLILTVKKVKEPQN